MPTCALQVALRPFLHHHTHSRLRPHLRLILRKKNAASAKRAYAAVVAAVRQQNPNCNAGEATNINSDANASLSLHDLKAETLTLLYKTSGLLPRVLPSRADKHDGPSLVQLDFWQELLNAWGEESERITDQNLRVVGVLSHSSFTFVCVVHTEPSSWIFSQTVYGYDEFSGSEDLVTALLEHPFASASQKEIVQTRWKGRTGSLVLQ